MVMMFQGVLVALKQVFRKFTANNLKFHVDKILVFDESEDPDIAIDYVSPKTSFHDLIKMIAIPEYRVEIRYVSHGRKMRYIFRSGQVAHFPPRRLLELKCSRDRILSARVRYNDGGSRDVTTRVLKYEGPNRDFNSNSNIIHVKDMFPFHDTDEMESLEIVYDDEISYTFAMHDIIVFDL